MGMCPEVSHVRRGHPVRWNQSNCYYGLSERFAEGRANVNSIPACSPGCMRSQRLPAGIATATSNATANAKSMRNAHARRPTEASGNLKCLRAAGLVRVKEPITRLRPVPSPPPRVATRRSSCRWTLGWRRLVVSSLDDLVQRELVGHARSPAATSWWAYTPRCGACPLQRV